ncbi:hypothetical protein FRC04_001717 [Tulasnella sp. 424]|nr:hypothetical protein FRC04_001717 [Tulasnella sp. 424]KAG8968455.1 hypothetical protein FRC05_001522 [Tulasnella sp. 425]
MSTEQVQLKKPVYDAPKAAPAWGTLPLDEAIDCLKNHIQTAVILELYTIPLYLYAAYSIKGSPLSTYKIINVVKQEMLHLGLAGNILCSIGGNPRVYGREYTPQYPSEIFYEPIEMNLLPATKETVHMFMEIEKPLPPPTGPKMPQHLLPNYRSIGQFYDEIERGLDVISKRCDGEKRELFHKSTFAKQLQTADGSWYDGDMAVITDLAAATKALDIIKTQGEGAKKGETPTSGIESHYEVFKDLHDNHSLDCYDIVKNINPEDYEEELFHGLMKASDAAFSYLLETIEILWKYDGPLRGRLVTNNVMNLMLTILKPLAVFLVQQKITKGPNAGKHAAAPYRLYEFGADPFGELKDITEKALAQYSNEPKLQEVGQYVSELIDLKQLNSV